MANSQPTPKFTGHKPYQKKHTHYICYIKVFNPDLFEENNFETCNAVFENFQSLTRHIKIEHNWSSEPPHCCQICEIYLRNRCEFLAHTIHHLKLLHSYTEAFFCCDACDKMYQDIFNYFDARNCQTFSPVTMDQKYFEYTDMSKMDQKPKHLVTPSELNSVEEKHPGP